VNNLVFLENNMIFTNSMEIAKGVNHSHTSVLRLIQNSMDLELFTSLKVIKVSTKGRPSDVYNLTEEQATLLIALMRNTPLVREFKCKLVKEFFKQRRALDKLLAYKGNAEHLAARKEGKTARLEETDWIKKFVNYATEQGSKSAHMYYVSISNMQNKALFFIAQKFPNLRDVMDFEQLALVKVADIAVKNAIKEGIEKSLPYKEIYVTAKNRVIALEKIFPKSPIGLLLEKSNVPFLQQPKELTNE